MTVARASRIERFLSQPSCRRTVYRHTGQVQPVKETVRGFKEILEGKHDNLPEEAFYMVGTIDDAVAKAREMEERE